MTERDAQRKGDVTAERRDEVVKRMLATPPQPHTKEKGREPKPAPAKK